MHARMVTLQVQPGKLDHLITVFREAILPVSKQQKGFVEVRLLVDRAANKAVVVGRWQSEAEVLASEASGFYQEQVAKIAPWLSAPPVRELFEIAVEGGA